MSTILITGSAGFIGYHTAKKLLEDGKTVIGLDNLNNYYDPKLKYDRNKLLLKKKNYKFYNGDICDNELVDNIFKSNSIDKICHLAAQAGVRHSLQHPMIYIDSNIKGFVNIFEYAKKYAVKSIIYASSSSVYGNDKIQLKGFRESQKIQNPISLYGATKIANEIMAYTYYHLYGIKSSGLRFFTVYGPWGRPDMAYMKFTKAIVEGKHIEVYNFGNMKRDFTYIDDIVAGIISAIDKTNSYKIYNLGSSTQIKLIEFIRILEAVLEKKAELKYLPKQLGDINQTLADISLATKELGYYPKTNFSQGIKEFIQWHISYY